MLFSALFLWPLATSPERHVKKQIELPASVQATQAPENNAQFQPENVVEAVKAEATNPQTPSPAGTCEDAIEKVWPSELQTGAKLTAQKESGMRADAVGKVNPDRYASRDYGCFQINNHWHKDFFANGDWSDPYYNAQFALALYKGREAQPHKYKNGWTAWYAVRGVLW